VTKSGDLSQRWLSVFERGGVALSEAQREREGNQEWIGFSRIDGIQGMR